MVRVVLGTVFTPNGLAHTSDRVGDRAMVDALVALRLKVRRMASDYWIVRDSDTERVGLISRAAVLRKFDDVIAGLNVDRSPYP